MNRPVLNLLILFLAASPSVCGSAAEPGPNAKSPVRTWRDTMTVPTYPWEEDTNPKFWALETGSKLSTTVRGAIVYPYTMQDHLLREKVDRQYQIICLENEYLQITCMPELGGRLFNVLDKTTGQQMFHYNNVIKPSMIAMRGAFITGGVEWNAGPHVHTVTILSPVDVIEGTNPDGSAYLEISNQEKILRTRWTVRLTLAPGRAYLDERIRIENPTDESHAYYFWNCTAFPSRAGTRFIYPMTLGTDHYGRTFFQWPIHEGRDLSWLKNYPNPSSIFAYGCVHDFFGAYDVDRDQGIVQVANHRIVEGKKAWTWGTSDLGLVAQDSLGDVDTPYIEVQSGPLPTQSDYGLLGPRQQVAWREWWYPVHGLGQEFDYATKDLAAEATRQDTRLELRLLATGVFPDSQCVLSRDGHPLLERRIDLSPAAPVHVLLEDAGPEPVAVRVYDRQGRTLAAFDTPLDIPQVTAPTIPDTLPVEQMTTDQKYRRAQWLDRATNRFQARELYEQVLADDPGHSGALRDLAVLDFEFARYEAAAERLEQAVVRDDEDGRAWFYLAACRLQMSQWDGALTAAQECSKRHLTAPLGADLIGRVHMRRRQFGRAVEAFRQAIRGNATDGRTADHLMIALAAAGQGPAAEQLATQAVRQRPTQLVPRALLALRQDSLDAFATTARTFVGEYEFNMIETSLVFAELGQYAHAWRLLDAACGPESSTASPSFLVLYYLAWFSAQDAQPERARQYLQQAAASRSPGVFPSRRAALPVFRYALQQNPEDAQAHLQFGNLLANLGQVQPAAKHWLQASRLAPGDAMAWRNLGVAAMALDNDPAEAERCFRRAAQACPADQTLWRDLAEVLLTADRRDEAIRVIESMPITGSRRAEITIMLAQAYADQGAYQACLDVLFKTPYFVNWEGQTITWQLFHRAHVELGKQAFEAGQLDDALTHFETAVTYPRKLNVGRGEYEETAQAQYWRGRTLAQLGRPAEASTAWQVGAQQRPGTGTQREYQERCRQALAADR